MKIALDKWDCWKKLLRWFRNVCIRYSLERSNVEGVAKKSILSMINFVVDVRLGQCLTSVELLEGRNTSRINASIFIAVRRRLPAVLVERSHRTLGEWKETGSW